MVGADEASTGGYVACCSMNEGWWNGVSKMGSTTVGWGLMKVVSKSVDREVVSGFTGFGVNCGLGGFGKGQERERAG